MKLIKGKKLKRIFIISMFSWLIMLPALLLNYRYWGFTQYIPLKLTELLLDILWFGTLTFFSFYIINVLYKKMDFRLSALSGTLRWFFIIIIFILLGRQGDLVNAMFLIELPIMIGSYYFGTIIFDSFSRKKIAPLFFASILSLITITSMVGVFSGGFLTLIDRPLATVNIFDESEPTSSFQCNNLKGICTPSGQELLKDYIEYGYCSVDKKHICQVKNLCIITDGILEVEFNENKGLFEKKCLCEEGKQYLIVEGCRQRYSP